jgi:phage recombination protein Bet
MNTDLTTAQDNYDISLLRKIFKVDDEVPEAELRIAEQYCKAKGLDPIKKPIAIIAFKKTVKEGNVKRDVTTYEIIPTAEAVKVVAARGNWAGNDDYVFGPEKTFEWEYSDYYTKAVTKKSVKAPEWGQITVYKIVGGVRCAFVGPRVYFAERNGKNTNWIKQPIAMLNKCILVAALRNACPEECAGMYIREELEADDTFEAKESKSPIPPIEQAKNEPPITEQEEQQIKAAIKEMKAKPEVVKKEEPEIIEVQAKEVISGADVSATGSKAIADNLVSMIIENTESNDPDVIDFIISEVDDYKAKKESGEFKMTITDHNRIAKEFLKFKQIKGVK